MQVLTHYRQKTIRKIININIETKYIKLVDVKPTLENKKINIFLPFSFNNTCENYEIHSYVST